MKRIALCISLATLLAAPLTSLAQNLTGTVLAGDTGAPISGAMVRAVGIASSRAQPPNMYQIQTDVNGKYALTVSSGQYRLCVSGAPGSYLDPCLWGGALVAAAGGVAPTVRLQKGAMFIARVHSAHELLTQSEIVRGAAITAHVSGGPFAQFPLPLVYESATVRDYGEVLPRNLAMTLVVKSPQLNLSDHLGAAVSLQGNGFTITDSDFAPTSQSAVKFGRAQEKPAAKMVHFYAK